MRLHDLIEQYIDYKRALGMRFISDAAVLRSYGRAMGDIPASTVDSEAALAFIAGTGSLTTRWGLKFRILRSFYRYALDRKLVSQSPLPERIPKLPPSLIPYIYSTAELDRLVSLAGTLHVPSSDLQATSMRCLLLLLYGTGMRIGEALALRLQDVDMEQHLVTIEDSKFFKSRLVPIGPRLSKNMAPQKNLWVASGSGRSPIA